jgi:hypothetical protein
MSILIVVYCSKRCRGTSAQKYKDKNNNSRLEETAIGDPVAGAVAEWADTDRAVVSSGGIRDASLCRERLGRRPGGCLPLF